MTTHGYAFTCPRCPGDYFYVRSDYELHLIRHLLEDLAAKLADIAKSMGNLPTAEDLARMAGL